MQKGVSPYKLQKEHNGDGFKICGKVFCQINYGKKKGVVAYRLLPSQYYNR